MDTPKGPTAGHEPPLRPVSYTHLDVYKRQADFINITVFGKTAELCANYLTKGRQCAIQGRIQTGSYTTQTGEKRYTTDVIADRVEFIGSKEQSSSPMGNAVQPDSSFFNDFPDEDNDIFEPVDDDDIPF